MIKCVLFDMDGTILDDEFHTLTARLDIANEMGCNLTKEQVLKSLGMSSPKGRKYFATITNGKFPYDFLSKKRFDLIIDDMKSNGERLKPYVKEIIKYCQDKGIIIGICTSSDTMKVSRLKEYCPILDEFDFIVKGDQISNGKPSPDIFLKGVELAKVNKDEVLVVEDATSGIEAAVNGDLKAIMIPDMCEPNDFVLSHNILVLKDMKEVIDYIEEFNK